MILPIAVALTGLGLSMIYLDLSYSEGARPAQPSECASSSSPASPSPSAPSSLVLLKDHRLLSRYTYTFGVASLILPLTLPQVRTT